MLEGTEAWTLLFHLVSVSFLIFLVFSLFTSLMTLTGEEVDWGRYP